MSFNTPENTLILHRETPRAQLSLVLLMSEHVRRHRLCAQLKGVGHLFCKSHIPLQAEHRHQQRCPACLMVVTVQSAYWDFAKKKKKRCDH